MKTLIATPCMDTQPVGFVQSLLYMHKGDNPTVYFRPNSLVYDSRNIISLTAIEQKYDNVLWLDSDMMFPPNTLLKLESYLNNDMDIQMVTGLYVTRHTPVEPVLYEHIAEPQRNPDGYLEKKITSYMDFPRDSFFPVAGCGFGCVMTTTKLLKEVWDKFGPAFTPFPWAGEDISFCHRVNLLGHQIYCDSSVSCGHIGTYVYTEKDLPKRGDDVVEG